MATLKLKSKPDPRARSHDKPARAPVRGAVPGSRDRLSAGQAQALREQQQKQQPLQQRPPREQAQQPHGRDRPEPPRPAPARRPEAPSPSPSQDDRIARGRQWLAEREARYQEQLRLRFGDRIPPEFNPRSEPRAPGERPPPQRQPSQPRNLRAAPNTAFERQPSSPPPLRPQPAAPVATQRSHGRQRARDVDADDDERDFGDDAPAHAAGSMRLSKRMSELGIASRREADEWIAKGWVRVDDQVVSELGSRVVPSQRITVDAKARFQQAQRVTVLIHKPIGYVSGQAEDGYEPAYVLVTPANQWTEDQSGTRFLREHLRNLAPAGRLDIDSTGLLVLTQDGRVAKQLIGEDSEVEKEYLVRVVPLAQGGDAAAFNDASLALLNHGLELDGEPLKPAKVEWLNDDQLRFVLTQGKKRQVRRMCELVGLKVVGLKRVRIGSVMLGDLPVGQWRYLRRDEAFG
jgi:23S rRNA pseudouridine2604 synthase